MLEGSLFSTPSPAFIAGTGRDYGNDVAKKLLYDTPIPTTLLLMLSKGRAFTLMMSFCFPGPHQNGLIASNSSLSMMGVEAGVTDERSEAKHPHPQME